MRPRKRGSSSEASRLTGASTRSPRARRLPWRDGASTPKERTPQEERQSAVGPLRHGTAVSTLPGPDESLVEDIGRRTEIAQVDMPKTRSMGRGNCANEGGRPMRTLSTCIMVGILAIATGCDTSNTPTPPAPVDGGNGGGDAAVVDGSRAGGDATAADGASGGNDATIPDTGANEAAAADGGIEAASLDGGSGGSDAPTGEGGGDAQSGDAGSCTLPACLATLAANCLPSGDCIQDDSLVLINGSTYSCYDGGITRGDIEPTIDGGVNLIAVEKAGATCYSMTYHAVDIFDNSSSSPIAVMNGSDAGVATLTKRASGDEGDGPMVCHLRWKQQGRQSRPFVRERVAALVSYPEHALGLLGGNVCVVALRARG